MVEAAQRTPVSLLLELCSQKGLVPEYELISVAGVSHEPTFEYKLKVQDIVVTAIGSSKKKAKHSVAKAALEQLLSAGGICTAGFTHYNETVTADSLKKVILEPQSELTFKESAVKNAVGVLQEHCAQHKDEWSAPYYETVSESGSPHDKLFSMSCVVLRFGGKVEERFTTFGVGKTKKIAKRQAAENMQMEINKYQETNPGITPAEESTGKNPEQEEGTENTATAELSSQNPEQSEEAESTTTEQFIDLNDAKPVSHLQNPEQAEGAESIATVQVIDFPDAKPLSHLQNPEQAEGTESTPPVLLIDFSEPVSKLNGLFIHDNSHEEESTVDHQDLLT